MHTLHSLPVLAPFARSCGTFMGQTPLWPTHVTKTRKNELLCLGPTKRRYERLVELNGTFSYAAQLVRAIAGYPPGVRWQAHNMITFYKARELGKAWKSAISNSWHYRHCYQESSKLCVSSLAVFRVLQEPDPSNRESASARPWSETLRRHNAFPLPARVFERAIRLGFNRIPSIRKVLQTLWEYYKGILHFERPSCRLSEIEIRAFIRSELLLNICAPRRLFAGPTQLSRTLHELL